MQQALRRRVGLMSERASRARWPWSSLAPRSRQSPPRLLLTATLVNEAPRKSSMHVVAAMCPTVDDRGGRCDPRVMRGHIRRAVTQHGADHVEGGAAPQHGRRGRMPEQIGPLRRSGDAGLPD